MIIGVATLLDELGRHGVTAYRLDADTVRLVPRAAVTPELVAMVRAAKPALLPILPAMPAQHTDPTPVPHPCHACGSTLYWRGWGDPALHCEGCERCPDVGNAAWYAAATGDDPLATIMDPDARAALLWWYRQGHPEIADDELSALRRYEAPGAPDVAATLARLVDRVRELRDAYWRAQPWGNA